MMFRVFLYCLICHQVSAQEVSPDSLQKLQKASALLSILDSIDNALFQQRFIEPYKSHGEAISNQLASYNLKEFESCLRSDTVSTLCFSSCISNSDYFEFRDSKAYSQKIFEIILSELGPKIQVLDQYYQECQYKYMGPHELYITLMGTDNREMKLNIILNHDFKINRIYTLKPSCYK